MPLDETQCIAIDLYLYRLDKLKSEISDMGARLDVGRLDINVRNYRTPEHCYFLYHIGGWMTSDFMQSSETLFAFLFMTNVFTVFGVDEVV